MPDFDAGFTFSRLLDVFVTHDSGCHNAIAPASVLGPGMQNSPSFIRGSHS